MTRVIERHIDPLKQGQSRMVPKAGLEPARAALTTPSR
jgi:hypothetical protein